MPRTEAERIAAIFGIPPVIYGLSARVHVPDPRCYCSHWGCRTGWWHCQGEAGRGVCFVAIVEADHDR